MPIRIIAPALVVFPHQQECGAQGEYAMAGSTQKNSAVCTAELCFAPMAGL
jgi:hypothetical protein